MSPLLSTLWPYQWQVSNNAVTLCFTSAPVLSSTSGWNSPFAPAQRDLAGWRLPYFCSSPQLRTQQQLPAFKYDGSDESITAWARSNQPHTAISLTSVDTHYWDISGRIQTGIGARLKCRVAGLNPEHFCCRFSTSSNSLDSTGYVSASSGPTEVNCKT